MTMPSIVVMNSLISATKVIANDSIPSPITASHNSMAIPSIPVPVSSLGIPVMNMKTDDDDDLEKPEHSSLNDVEKMEEKQLSDAECPDGELKKCEEEPMPDEAEDDKMLDKGRDNCCESDIDVGDDRKVASNGNREDKPPSNSAEPMECASVASFASPKHTMTTDIVMAENVSVNDRMVQSISLSLIQFPFRGQTSSTGSMQVESSDTSLTSNTEMHDIVDKYVLEGGGHEEIIDFSISISDAMTRTTYPSTISFCCAICSICPSNMVRVRCKLSMNSTG